MNLGLKKIHSQRYKITYIYLYETVFSFNLGWWTSKMLPARLKSVNKMLASDDA